MKIPQSMWSLFQDDVQLNALVNRSIDELSVIIKSEVPYFFPEYTDHGPQHNSDVLATAVGLLNDVALDSLTSADGAALILSVLYHDSGMHLTAEGFLSLLSEERPVLPEFDTISWPELWKLFMAEARRFNDTQLRSLFGDTSPVQDIPEAPIDFSTRDRMLIGEFLRRHHPRIGHEIACFGVPGISARKMTRSKIESEFANLCGFMARSHGLSMRNATDISGKFFRPQLYKNVHVTLIMALIRVSDYLQVQASRADHRIFAVHRLTSPYSNGEWKMHDAIRDIGFVDADPEAISLYANPQDVQTFLRVQSWAKDFQRELDDTWASLGEIYGRFHQEGWSGLGLRLRRLKTNLDDVKNFSKLVTYLPARIAFSSSSAELLSLLIEPLYGKKPEIGIRELGQNAMDAVVERCNIESSKPTELLSDVDTDVLIYPVCADGHVRRVVIQDRGVGMSGEVIRDYFLNAGASFRNSEAWRSVHLDENGKSKIARSGRFGVGALAAFLIGDKIEVTTRSRSSSTGLYFKATLSDPSITVEKCDFQVGTKIEVHVSESMQERVDNLFELRNTNKIQESWNFFLEGHPTIIRLDKGLMQLPCGPKFELSGWTKVKVDGFDAVYWSYIANDDEEAELWCNGIKICKLKDEERRNFHSRRDEPIPLLGDPWISKGIRLKTPNIMVSDNDGLLPLNLQRNAIGSRDFEIEAAMRQSLQEDLIAQALAKAPTVDIWNRDVQTILPNCNLLCDFEWSGSYGESFKYDWFWQDDGWLVADPTLIQDRTGFLLLHQSNRSLTEKFLKDELSGTVVFLDDVEVSSKNSKQIANFLEKVGPRRNRLGLSQYNYSLTAISERAFTRVNRTRQNSVVERILENMTLEDNVALLSNKKLDGLIDTALIAGALTNKVDDFFFTFSNGATPPAERLGPSEFSSLWEKYIGKEKIPSSYKEREMRFPMAFEVLGEKISKHNSR